MPYTQENFFQENYPQWHQKVVFAEQKGWLEGKVEMARAFKQRGIDIGIIAETSGIPIEQVRML